MNLTDEAVKALLDGATPGPWLYRPHKHDDWGVVRGGAFNIDWGGYPHLAQVRDPDKTDDPTLAQHRVTGKDPWEGNARLTAAAPDLARALLDARAELARLNGQVASLRTETDAYRMCVNCGLIVPSAHDRAQSGPGCESPDACTFDLTPREAWEYWRAKAHQYRAALAQAQPAAEEGKS